MQVSVWRTALGLLMLCPGLAFAADFDGGRLSAWWAIPFVGILLSIALMPLLTPLFWHHHFGKVSAAWSLAFLLPFAALFGTHLAVESLVHALVAEYIPFIVLLTALFTVAGGIHISGNLHGAPGLNTLHPGDRHGAGEPHGHHRCVDAADPSADPRQRQSSPPGARGGVLHLPGVQRRRLADAARATRRCSWASSRAWISSGRLRNILPETALHVGFAAGDLLPARQLALHARKACCRWIRRRTRGPIGIQGKANFALLGVIIGAGAAERHLEVAGGLRRLRHRGRACRAWCATSGWSWWRWCR